MCVSECTVLCSLMVVLAPHLYAKCSESDKEFTSSGSSVFAGFLPFPIFFFRFFLVLPSHRRRGWYRAANSVVSSGEDSVPSLCEG